MAGGDDARRHLAYFSLAPAAFLKTHPDPYVEFLQKVPQLAAVAFADESGDIVQQAQELVDLALNGNLVGLFLMREVGNSCAAAASRTFTSSKT